MTEYTEQFKKDTMYLNEQYKDIIGKTVAYVRPLFDDELEDFYWFRDGGAIPMLIVFTDGTTLIPSSDPEGNQAGFLFVEKLEDEEEK